MFIFDLRYVFSFWWFLSFNCLKRLKTQNNNLREGIKALQAKINSIPQTIEVAVKEKMAKSLAREGKNYKELYRAVTGKTFFIDDEDKDPNQVLKEILNLKEEYARILEFDKREEQPQRSRGLKR